MRYGFTTHSLSASTIRIAPAMVRIQSSVTRTPCGRPGKRRASGSRLCRAAYRSSSASSRNRSSLPSYPWSRVIRPLPLPRRVVVAGPLPRRALGRPAARRVVALLRLVVVGPVAPEVAGIRLVLGPAARLPATEAALILLLLLLLLVLVLVVELAAVIAPVVAHRTCSRRQASTRAWSPESSTSGTGQPWNSAGRV